MQFANVPPADYRIGQRITINGRAMTITGRTHTGRNLMAESDNGRRFVLIVSDQEPIAGIPAATA